MSLLDPKLLPVGIVLAAPGGVFSAVGDRRDDNGQPVQRYRKAIARVGEFVADGGKKVYRITEDLIRHWGKVIPAMIASGTRIPVPVTHDFTGDPDKNRGYVVNAYVDGSVLVAEIDMIGEDAIKAASRSDVSVYSPPTWPDSKGKTWEWPILHVALTTCPVVTDLGPFVPIAASHGTSPAQVPVLMPKESTMDLTELLKSLEEKLGLKDLKPENAVEIIASHAANLKAAAGNHEALASQVTSLSSERDSAKREATRLQGEIDRLRPFKMSRDAEAIAVRKVDDDLERLVIDGCITAAVRDKIRPLLKETSFMLSLETRDSGAAQARAFELLDALRDNKPVKAGEQSGHQGIVADRATPGATGADGNSQDGKGADGKNKASAADEVIALANATAKDNTSFVL